MGQVNGQARTMGNKAKRLGLGLDSGYGGSGAATGTGAGSCLSWHLGCGYMSKAPQGVEANLKREREMERVGERENLPKRRTKIL